MTSTLEIGSTRQPVCRETEANAEAWQIVLHLTPCLRIAHHIPGRIRLRLDLAAFAACRLPGATADRLESVLTRVRGIRRVQLNAVARSCVVDYDIDVIAAAAWPDLLGGRDTPAAAGLLAALREQGAAAGHA